MINRLEIKKSFLESSNIIRSSISLVPKIEKSIKVLLECVQNGNKIILFGNGGSAADAQHIAAELIGKFKKKRRSIPAIALTTDSSVLTSLSNDYSFDIVFSRQCESLVSPGDVVIGITTSGNSKNIINGIRTSKKRGAITIGLLGNKGGKLKMVDIPIIVNSSNTPRIQEVHRIIAHIICEMVEKELTKNFS